jgi:hypothetical protein
VSSHQHPLLTVLCRPFSKPLASPLSDCIEKFEKAHVSCLEAPVDELRPAFAYPKLLFVSFFAPGSAEEQFLQKVQEACSARLGPAIFSALPTLDTAAEAITFSTCGALSAIVLAFDSSTQSKAASWLGLFGSDLQPLSVEKPPLISKKGLFGVPLYELIVPPVQDVAFKGALWKALQAAI